MTHYLEIVYDTLGPLVLDCMVTMHSFPGKEFGYVGLEIYQVLFLVHSLFCCLSTSTGIKGLTVSYIISKSVLLQ